MTRLVAFGCSLTFGQSLVDNHPDNDYPSEHAWPNVLAKKLNMVCVNNGKPGASNKQIAWNIQNFEFHKDDVVVILWSHPDRYCIIEHDSIRQLGIWQPENIDFFKNFHNEYDMLIDMHTRIQYAELFLAKKDIKCFHLHPTGKYKMNFSWFDIPVLDLYFNEIRTKYQLAENNHHPGIDAHCVFADKIYNLIKDRQGPLL